ncbi:MAG: serine/threonine protein kinase, partial [Bryobacterales bacterium]|nr:serine/threonine protein kinase [Bryobacterales bacterium]
LGSGGMGIVYLAHRGDGEFRREVAIKIAGGRLFAPEAERRFIHERQILAQLDHPNIVRLLDGGIADSQRYFVMEYIAGQPLLEYARAKNLSDCLRLFLDICSAVHYAHQRLIIHRDLKAANILVNAEGVVKLLDFGIAQIVEPGGGSTGATFLRPVSLACMSPEQVRGESLTLATDIYSLGVLLYELTAGINPQFRDGDSYAEAVERVLHADPPPPGHHNRSLPRDLDAVVLKAIAKDPRERYSS